jgi:hypothetical protein
MQVVESTIGGVGNGDADGGVVSTVDRTTTRTSRTELPRDAPGTREGRR